MPAQSAISADLMPADDMREFLEFNGTAVERLGERLGDTEQALARGELGTALHLLRQAKTTQAVIAKSFSSAGKQLGELQR